MSEKDNFGTGFLLGTIVGGLVGGVAGGIIGTVIANKSKENPNTNEDESADYSVFKSDDQRENAHLSLEDKINQLNHAIDDVRITLSKNTETQVESS